MKYFFVQYVIFLSAPSPAAVGIENIGEEIDPTIPDDFTDHQRAATDIPNGN